MKRHVFHFILTKFGHLNEDLLFYFTDQNLISWESAHMIKKTIFMFGEELKNLK